MKATSRTGPPPPTIGRSGPLSRKRPAAETRKTPSVTARQPIEDDVEEPVADEPADIELAIVTMLFDSVDPEPLLAVLAKYVVLSRGHAGCRNIDLAVSATRPNRLVVLQKWESPAAQRAHFDSPEMVDMAAAAGPLLEGPPIIDLLDAISAHDLR